MTGVFVLRKIHGVRGGGTTILEDGGGTSALLTPVFAIFRSHWMPFYVQLDRIDPLFLQKKIGLSLSHLVPDII